jgi:hypothetical protein
MEFKSILKAFGFQAAYDAIKSLLCNAFSLKGGIMLTAIEALWALLAGLPGPVILVLTLACVAFIVDVYWFIRWLRERTPNSGGSPLSRAVTTPIKIAVVEFGMPYDFSGNTEIVWTHIGVSVIGDHSIERCEAFLFMDEPTTSKTEAFHLAWRSVGQYQPELTLDPGKGPYAIAVARRDERDRHGNAEICDAVLCYQNGTYRSTYTIPGNGISAGTELTCRIVLKAAGNVVVESYKLKITVPPKVVSNGKFRIEPQITWKADAE